MQHKKYPIMFKLIIFALLVISSGVATAQNDFLANNIDKSVSPADDFFQYANGGWIKKTKLPASESSWGIGNLVQEEIYSRILAINKKASTTNNKAGTAQQKIGDFWKAAMDTGAINKKGLTELSQIFTTVNSLTNNKTLQTEIGNMHIMGLGGFFSYYVGQDDKNSESIVSIFGQGGLGMPNREYYFKTDERTVKVQKAYKTMVSKVLTNVYATIGKKLSPAQALSMTESVYQLEKKLAEASRKLEDLRDPYANYNKMTLKDLTLKSGFNFENYGKAIGIKNLGDSIIVGQPAFFEKLGNLLQTGKTETWRNYMFVRIMQRTSSHLDDKTVNLFLDYRKALVGVSTLRPRWKRMIDAQENMMGELLGQLFVKEYFNQEAKDRYTNLVEDIRNVYADRIQKLDWMSDTTKIKALDKLKKVSKKVGFPDTWKDMSRLTITKDSHIKNYFSSNIFWHQYEMQKLGKPVDRNEWQMTPQTYNAYYNPSNNEIVLPAGIFAVPGMKDADLDDAFVYGYAGASTIGHEITHGFDDQGRQYDAQGNLTDWWTKTDADEYVKRAKTIVAQFNEMMPVDTIRVNGEATQGENIADLGGLVIGLEAFKKTKQYQEGKLIGGLTPIQRYFLGYAYGWMYQVKKESLVNQLMTDVHSPAKERVNGPMVNMQEFYDAFGVKEGSKMYRAIANRVSIW